jgi:hypothetical protein
LGQRKVAEIRRTDIERLHAKVSARTPIRANRVLALVSTMFSLAQRLEWRPDNPCRGVRKNPERSRERYLTGDELRRLVEVLATFPNREARRSRSRATSWEGEVCPHRGARRTPHRRSTRDACSICAPSASDTTSANGRFTACAKRARARPKST